MRRSDLPFGSEFSPSQTDPSTLLTVENQIRPGIGKFLRGPLSEILKEVKSGDKRKRLLALKALVFYLMHLIDLTYIGTHLKMGKGIRVFGERPELLLRRWQIFCTNESVDVDQIATEVGLIDYFGCRVACIVSTKKFLRGTRRYIEAVRPVLPRALVLIDGKTLRMTADRPTTFVESIISQAPFAFLEIG